MTPFFSTSSVDFIVSILSNLRKIKFKLPNKTKRKDGYLMFLQSDNHHKKFYNFIL